jgi:hypothetical protein
LGISGLGAEKPHVRTYHSLILGSITSSILFDERHKAISRHFLLNLFPRDQDAIDIQVAFFALSFPLRKMEVNDFPFLVLEVLPELPFLELTFVF